MINSQIPSLSPVTRSKAEAQAAYDGLSRWYDLLAGDWERGPRDLGLRRLAAQPGERVLEIGCGTGHGIRALAAAVGATGHTFGLDLSPKMLAQTRSSLKPEGKVSLACGDAVYLPHQEAAFEAVFLSFTLELFDTPEIPMVLAECRRVLRPGGRLGVVALSREGGSAFMLNLYEWAHRTFPKVVDCRPIFVREAIQAAEFQIFDTMQIEIWRLPVEVVLAVR